MKTRGLKEGEKGFQFFVVVNVALRASKNFCKNKYLHALSVRFAKKIMILTLIRSLAGVDRSVDRY